MKTVAGAFFLRSLLRVALDPFLFALTATLTLFLSRRDDVLFFFFPVW